jgi:nucleosome binding factor SPN SPT16 subunit
MELSYTEGPMNLNWKQIMATVAADDRFYMDTEEDEVTPKEAGWEFLRMYGNEDTEEEEDEEDDSEFDEEEEVEGSAQSVSTCRHIGLWYFIFLYSVNLTESKKNLH